MTTTMYYDMCFDLTDEKIALMQSTQECDAALAGLGHRHTSHCETMAILMPGHPCSMRPDVKRQTLLLQERRNVLVTKGRVASGGSSNTGGGSGGGGERELELVPIGREYPAPVASPTVPAPSDLHSLRNQRHRRRALGAADDDDDEGDGGGGSSGAPPPVPVQRPRG